MNNPQQAQKFSEYLARLHEKEREVSVPMQVVQKSPNLAVTNDELLTIKKSLNQLEKDKYNQAVLLRQIHTELRSYQLETRNLVDSIRRGTTQIRPPAVVPVIKTPPPLPIIPTPPPLPLVEAVKPTLPVVKKKSKLPAVRKFTSRSLILASLIAFAYFGWTKFSPGFSSDAGTVAGVTTITPSPQATQSGGIPEYNESFAEVPFAETTWEKANDPDFGISIEYPKNTSNRVQTVGGNNIWFLRKSGYLLKITKQESDLPLDQWIETNKSDYVPASTVIKSTFKNQPAYIVQEIDRGNAVGYQYILKRGTTLYFIWIKQEPVTTDDGQRVARMITSLQFTN